MIKKLALSIAVAIAMATTAKAATITWSVANAAANLLARADGVTLLPVGNYVRLGYFNDGFSFAGVNPSSITIEQFNAINSAFNQLDFDRIGNGTGNQAGTFTEQHIFNPDSPSLVGKQLVFLAYHSSDFTSVATAVSSASEFGVYFLDKGAGVLGSTDWGIRTDVGVPGGTTASLDIGDLNGRGGAGSDPLIAAGNVPVGGYTAPGQVNAFGGRNFTTSTVVPEPASASLLALGAVALLARRRRQA